MKSGSVYWAYQSLIWGSLAFYVPGFFATVFECRPMWVYWNRSKEGYCINRETLLVVYGVTNMILNILTLVLPVWVMGRLQIISKSKASIVAISATGLL